MMKHSLLPHNTNLKTNTIHTICATSIAQGLPGTETMWLPTSVFSSIMLLMALLLAAFARADDSPYDYQRYFRALSCPIDPSSTAYVTITLPVVRSSNDRFPTVVLLNGFVMRSCVYAPYANTLAAHGYAVIQFDDAKNPRSDFSVRLPLIELINT